MQYIVMMVDRKQKNGSRTRAEMQSELALPAGSLPMCHDISERVKVRNRYCLPCISLTVRLGIPSWAGEGGLREALQCHSIGASTSQR